MSEATPLDPQSGATGVTFDALEFVPEAVTPVPEAKRLLVRGYGAYAARPVAGREAGSRTAP